MTFFEWAAAGAAIGTKAFFAVFVFVVFVFAILGLLALTFSALGGDGDGRQKKRPY